MAISGQANINIGAENQVAGSDTLFEAFHTIQNNFTTLFETSSSFDTFRAGEGVTVAANASNGVVSITNTGVLRLTAGSGVSLSGASGNITISTIPQGPFGVFRVGLTSNSLSVTGGNIVSQGNFTVDLPRIATGEQFAAGEYIAPTLTVDGFGRITEIANGVGVGTVTSIGLSPGKGIGITGGPIVDTGTIAVENTGVTSVQGGRGIQVSGSNGDITISVANLGEGSVKSVIVSSNSLTVTGSPITDVGTITVDLPQTFIDSLYSNATANSYLPTFSGNLAPNNIVATGNISANNITALNTLHAEVVSANTFSGSFSGNATTAGTVTANAQPNITSTGTLVSLNVTGNANVGANLNLTGNAVISGNANMYIMTANLATVESGLEIGHDGYVLFRSQNLSGNYVAFLPPISVPTAGLAFALPNSLGTSSQVLGTDGSGTLLWKAYPPVGSNTQIQFNDSGVANGSTGLTYTKTTSTLTAGNLSVTGNASAANVLATTAMTAPKFVSNVATGTAPFTVTSITQVANLNSAMAGTVVTNAQPNITSTGTLTSLTVSGNLTVQGNVAFSGANVTLGSNANVKISGGTNGQVLTTNGSGALTWTTAGGFDGSTVITISNTTAATSTTTGALKVSGGVGVAGNIFAGGNIVATGKITTTDVIQGQNITATGWIQSNGNIDAGSSWVNGSVLSASSTLFSWGNQAATSTTTGDLIVAGGAGIGGNIYSGGDIVATGNITAANIVTTGSTGNITGANVISANVLTTVAKTFSGLPSASSAGAGARAFVTDANLAASGNFGAAISGSGANNVPVYSDGTSWRIG